VCVADMAFLQSWVALLALARVHLCWPTLLSTSVINQALEWQATAKHILLHHSVLRAVLCCMSLCRSWCLI
jgi:hypothetical protein